MKVSHVLGRFVLAVFFAALAASACAQSQSTKQQPDFQPQVGQEGAQGLRHADTVGGLHAWRSREGRCRGIGIGRLNFTSTLPNERMETVGIRLEPSPMAGPLPTFRMPCIWFDA